MTSAQALLRLLCCYGIHGGGSRVDARINVPTPKKAGKLKQGTRLPLLSIDVNCGMLLPAPTTPSDCNTMTSSPKKPKCWNTLGSRWWIKQIEQIHCLQISQSTSHFVLSFSHLFTAATSSARAWDMRLWLVRKVWGKRGLFIWKKIKLPVKLWEQGELQ